MRIVALEEHISLPAFNDELDAKTGSVRDHRGTDRVRAELEDVDGVRLKMMDASGISFQVMSVPGFGATLLPPDAAPDYTRRYNDTLTGIVRAHAGKLAAFAHLPLSNPEAAADELERAVRDGGMLGFLMSGTVNGKFLDDKAFEPVLARAEKLDVPVYIHPGVPPPSVREAYYNGFSDRVSTMFATAGWGWHAETAVHVLRLVLGGTFERHPKLKVIVGHMGEGLPAAIARCDDILNQKLTGLPRTVSQTILDQVWLTTAGFFTLPPFIAALLTFGADRILFSIDYPFADTVTARAFLDSLPVSPADKIKIAHGNADKLLKLTS